MKPMKVGKPQFTKPSPKDIKEEFEKKGVGDPKQAMQFFYYYESIDWYVGKNKMRSWRAAVAGWVNRMKDFEPKKFGNKEPDKIATGMNQALTPQQLEDLNQIKRAYAKQRAQ